MVTYHNCLFISKDLWHLWLRLGADMEMLQSWPVGQELYDPSSEASGNVLMFFTCVERVWVIINYIYTVIYYMYIIYVYIHIYIIYRNIPSYVILYMDLVLHEDRRKIMQDKAYMVERCVVQIAKRGWIAIRCLSSLFSQQARPGKGIIGLDLTWTAGM